MSFIIYALLASLTLALPLWVYREQNGHSPKLIVFVSFAEALAICASYGATLLVCLDPEGCDTGWAKTALPILFATMNIGMIWPIIAGYAKQAEKDKALKTK